MALVLGIDTSNYTTSCAVFDTDSGAVIKHSRLLPVKEVERGIRQSDSVYHHTVQLAPLLKELFSDLSDRIDAVCASSSPRMQEDSYMPCFLVGLNTAQSISCAMNIPLFTTSHQHGHIAAALYSADALKLIKERFIAFHISGGTTEGVVVDPSEDELFLPSIAARTSDLNAGQLIDRIGVKMGLKFPCGRELEKLAECYSGDVKISVTLKDCDCSISGYENKLTDLYLRTNDKPMTAMHTLMFVEKTVSKMTEKLIKKYGELPIVYAGGVMSDKIIRSSIESKFRAFFAEPELSCDNAVGVAVIGGYKYKRLTESNK